MHPTILKVFVKPNARTIKYKWLEKGILKVEIPAPPQQNKANLHLLDFLSERLALDVASIQIKGGATSKHKFVYVPLTLDLITEKLP